MDPGWPRTEITSAVESPKVTPIKVLAGIVVVVVELVVGEGSWSPQLEKITAIPVTARIINRKIFLITQSLHLNLARCKSFDCVSG